MPFGLWFHLLSHMADELLTNWKHDTMILKTMLKRITLLYLVYIDSAHSCNFPISLPLSSRSDGCCICKFVSLFSTFRPNVCSYPPSREFVLLEYFHQL